MGCSLNLHVCTVNRRAPTWRSGSPRSGPGNPTVVPLGPTFVPLGHLCTFGSHLCTFGPPLYLWIPPLYLWATVVPLGPTFVPLGLIDMMRFEHTFRFHGGGFASLICSSIHASYNGTHVVKIDVGCASPMGGRATFFAMPWFGLSTLALTVVASEP